MKQTGQEGYDIFNPIVVHYALNIILETAKSFVQSTTKKRKKKKKEEKRKKKKEKRKKKKEKRKKKEINKNHNQNR